MAEYTRQIMKVIVAKICQTIGWHSINSTPLDIMVDILRRYFIELTKLTHMYATQFGHVQPNLDELGLAFRDMHINIADLEEYIQFVDSALSMDIPPYPIPKESHLNFLKPGSNEVVTRPVHIQEYLPPMLPEKRDNDGDISTTNIKREESPSSPTNDFETVVFKRPADIVSEIPNKRPRLLLEEEGRPTREISSVMMTTSGFLSPAREGKLPEARTPVNTLDPLIAVSAQPTSYTNSQTLARFDRKSIKTLKDIRKNDKRRERTNKELFKAVLDDPIVKKIAPAKDSKTKMPNKGNVISATVPSVDTTEKCSENSLGKNATKLSSPGGKSKSFKIPKTEKPVPAVTVSSENVLLTSEEKFVEGKLSSEPDKLKLNIFKKISKVKDDKIDKIEKMKVKEESQINDTLNQSRESSPDLIIDESDIKNLDHMKNSLYVPATDDSNKVDKKTVKESSTLNMSNKIPDMNKCSPRSEKEFLYEDYISPPGTPLTPKTPEMPPETSTNKVEKRKKKDKHKPKNKTQICKASIMNRPKVDVVELELERPKTPDPVNVIKNDQLQSSLSSVFQFLPSFSGVSLPGGPGLIPSPITNPLFPRLPVTLPRPGFGEPAHIPPIPALSFVPLRSVEEPVLDIPSEITPADTVPKTENEFDNITPNSVKEKHKKDKKDRVKKRNKKDKTKNKSEKRKTKEEKREKEKIKKGKKEKKKEKERDHEGSVPKLTLKISSPRPPTPDVQIARKIMIKPVMKKDDNASTSNTNEPTESRQPSPELARISALITRPPKTKTTKDSHGEKDEMTISQMAISPKPNGSSASRSRICNLNKTAMAALPSHSEEKLAPNKIEKPNLFSQRSTTQEMEENKVWICPACGSQDDGSPMIGCDDCDAWYHWVCVGIQVPPDDSEDWYCRICIVKKQEMLQVDKKKRRKRKEKKNAE